MGIVDDERRFASPRYLRKPVLVVGEKYPASQKASAYRSGPGVYLIGSDVDARVYVGSSWNVAMRWGGHQSTMTDKYMTCGLRLKLAVRAHGIEHFYFELLEKTHYEDLQKRENYWMQYYDCADPDKGYNECSGAKIVKRTVLGYTSPPGVFLPTPWDEDYQERMAAIRAQARQEYESNPRHPLRLLYKSC